MKLYLIPLVASLAVVAGCNHAVVKNPQQAVLAIRVAYTDAVEAASTYGNPAVIPLCTTPKTVLVCANAPVVLQIKVAKDAAKPVIDGAEATVLNPAFDTTTSAAIILSAENALKALTAITTALHLKAPPKTP